MSHAATSVQPVVVDVPVNLTAVVRAEPEAGGYSASIPALPGCHTQGETLEEVRANLREGTKLRVRSEDEVHAAGGPSRIALLAAASLE